MAGKPMRLLGRTRKAFILIISLLLLVQLACISVELGVKVVPEGPDNGHVEFMVAYRLTEKYVEEAKKANQELTADYIDADQTPPEKVFPESFDDFDEKPDLSGMPGGNYQIISETPTEIIASSSAKYGPGEEPIESLGLSTTVDENGWTHYIFETELPEYGDEETVSSIDKLEQDGLGPKPPVKPPETEPSEEGDGMLGLFAALSAMGSEAEGEISLEAWYAERILLNSGLPQYTYMIQMPGQIQSHTIDSQTAGTLDEDGTSVTLVLDENYLRTYGGGAHTLHIESVAHPCAIECATGPHWVWDGNSEADSCSCICEQGWQPDESGDCVSCDEFCAGLDPRALGDPAESTPNICACRCAADLMQWDPEGKCVCSVGAEPSGDGCVCKEGWEYNEEGTGCVPAEEPTPEGSPTPVGCQLDKGMTCASNPLQCSCLDGKICDIFSKYRDNVGCAKPIAVYMVSPELTTYEQWWLSIKMSHIQRFFRSKGYQVEIVTMKTGDEATEALGNPSTRAVAYFGHGAYPSIEHVSSDKLKNAIHTNLVTRYRKAGLTKDQANQLASERSSQLNMDYAYIHTCYSLSDTTLRDFLVKPGGTYWGKEELLSAVAGLKESVRPAQ